MEGILGFFSWDKSQSGTHSIVSSKREEPGNKPFKCFILLTGKTLNSHNALMDRLKRQVPDLQVVQTEAECDIILVFCPVVRGPEYDIKAALEKLNDISGTKPAVLVVLHHTFDSESVVSDSSRAVSRENTVMVNCLFHEDRGLLQCQKNYESLTRIARHIKLQIQSKKNIKEKMETGQSCVPTGSHLVEKKKMEQMKRKYQGQAEMARLKYFILLTGQTLNTHKPFIGQLEREIPQLQQVSTVDECDVILAFCPVVSRAGTDIEAAVKKLNQESADKPAVLVVLHLTFDPECVVPNSSRSVHRENTITVDCLFYEDQGLLQCQKNQESFTRVINYIKPKICPILFTKEARETEKSPKQPAKKKHKYFICKMGNIPKFIKDVMGNLEEMSDLQEVKTEEECDFILTFCPAVSRDGTDFQKALKELESISETKHLVLVKPQGICVAPEISIGVNSDKHESVQSSGNDEPDAEMYEPMEAQEAGGPSQSSDKQENLLLQTEPSKTTLESMKKELQEKDRKIVGMENELKKLKAELAELKKNEIPTNETERQHIEEHLQVVGRDRCPSVRMQAQKTVSGVKAELANIIQILLEKKDDLESVNKLLSEGI